MPRPTNEKIDLIMNVKKDGRRTTFEPTLTELQGELAIQDIRSDKIPGVMNMIGGVIPGHQIQVDTKGRFVRFVHRLSLPENERLWKDIKKLSGSELIRWRLIGELPESQEHKVAKENWPTWLYHLWKGVDSGMYHIMSGKIPDLKEIFAFGLPIKLAAEGSQPRRTDPKRNIGWLYPDEFEAFYERVAPDQAHAAAHSVG